MTRSLYLVGVIWEQTKEESDKITVPCRSHLGQTKEESDKITVPCRSHLRRKVTRSLYLVGVIWDQTKEESDKITLYLVGVIWESSGTRLRRKVTRSPYLVGDKIIPWE